jgi:hypothetical protein
MLTNLDILFSRLKDAEYAYLLLEPVPLFGLFFGLVFFAVGLYLAQDKCRVAALIVICASCASVYPMMKYRNKGMPRILQTRSKPNCARTRSGFTTPSAVSRCSRSLAGANSALGATSSCSSAEARRWSSPYGST